MGSILHRLGMLSGATGEVVMIESTCKQCKLPLIVGEVPTKVGKAITSLACMVAGNRRGLREM